MAPYLPMGGAKICQCLDPGQCLGFLAGKVMIQHHRKSYSSKILNFWRKFWSEQFGTLVTDLSDAPVNSDIVGALDNPVIVGADIQPVGHPAGRQTAQVGRTSGRAPTDPSFPLFPQFYSKYGSGKAAGKI